MKGARTTAGPADQLFRQVEDEADRLPDYAELYRRWEAQPWSPLALDFSRDAEQWRTATPAQRRRWLGIGRFHGFHLGEAHLMRALAAFLEALPRPDQKRFVATQIADEARHDAFFERFLQQALGLPPEETSDEAVLPRLSPGMRHLFLELLPARACRLAADPQDTAALVEGVALVHLLIEGTLALANMRVVLHDFRRLGLFPGFQAGFLHVVRDEARHVLFGVRVLRDLAREPALREDASWSSSPGRCPGPGRCWCRRPALRGPARRGGRPVWAPHLCAGGPAPLAEGDWHPSFAVRNRRPRGRLTLARSHR